MERATPPPKIDRLGGFWRKSTAALGGLALSVCLASDGVLPEVYTPPTLYIAHDNFTCPKDAQFGVLNIPGLGQNNVGEFAANATEKILGSTYDECDAGINYGSEYNPAKNAEIMSKFIETNNLPGVILVAQSFGGISAVDIITEYHRAHPDSQTKFSIIFVSSLADTSDLKDMANLGLNVAATIGTTDQLLYAATWLGIVHGGKDPTDAQVQRDIRANAAATPARLFNEQIHRIALGMSALPEGMDVPAYSIIDEKDALIEYPGAIKSIENASKVRMLGVASISHPDSMQSLGNHADLWWLPYQSLYQRPITRAVTTLLDTMGVRSTAPRPCSPDNASPKSIGVLVCR